MTTLLAAEAKRYVYVQNRPALSCSDKTSRVLEQQNQLTLVRRRWLETKTSIKRISHNQNAAPFVWRKREVKGARLRNTIVNLRN